MFGPSGLLMLCSGLKPCVMAYLLLRSEFVALLAILVDLKAPWLSKPRDVPPLSLVVLPFADLSDDHKTRNLAEGIVQDVTTELSRVGQITVVAPSTASAYARKPIGVRGIGRALRVRYVLQGSVEGTGDQVRVTAQLSDAETAAILWAHRFDGSADDRLGLEDEVTGQIAAALVLAMVRTDAARAVDRPEQLDLFCAGAS